VEPGPLEETLLRVTDPSARRVLDDDPKMRESVVTDGFRIAARWVTTSSRRGLAW
jgi:hypothetical protein